MTEFAHPEYLVEPSWLAEHLEDDGLVVLDVTARLTSSLHNRAADDFAAAHIPGSVFFDSAAGHGVLSDPDAALPWMWPPPDRIAEALQSAGVGPASRVVITARTPRSGIDAGTMWCTRAWWTLHHSGIDCAILRGGLERWQAEGRPVAEGPAPAPGAAAAPILVDGRPIGRATKQDVLDAIGDGSACLIDALPTSSFDGTDAGYGPRRGHITGAENLPFRSLVDAETAGFPDANELHRRLQAAGLFDRGPVITYCGGAIAATVPAFALALFAKTDVRVYDGSLMEWSADESLPMSHG